MADRAPMCDEGIRVALQVHPAGQDIAGGSDQEPAVGAEAGDELISHRRDNGGVNGQKWEAGGLGRRPQPVPLDPASWAAVERCLRYHRELRTANPHLLVARKTKATRIPASEDYTRNLLRPAGATPACCAAPAWPA